MTDVHNLIAEIEANQIAPLRRMADKMANYSGWPECAPGPTDDDLTDAANAFEALLAHIRTLQQAVEEAREVIKPFAEIGSELKKGHWATLDDKDRPTFANIMVGSLRRASTWLSKHGSKRDG